MVSYTSPLEAGSKGNKMRVFITICTSDSYVPGVLALNRSLKAVESRYPLYLLTTSQLSDTSLTQIKGEGIEVLFDAPITPGAYVRHQNEINGSPNWNNTFFKLRIFGLTQFDKLIYLDSDMIVAANIDYLFDKPHMSAVAAGRGFNPTWRQLNSGLMVIEPDRQMMDDLLKLVTDEPDPGMLNGQGIGDQDIINWYYRTWPENEWLHLPETYNQFVTLIPEYLRSGLLDSFADIKVIHFVGKVKPWAYKSREYLHALARAVRYRSLKEFRAISLFKELLG